MKRAIAPLVAVVALVGCAEAAPTGVSDEAREVVEAAIAAELVPETMADNADVVEQMRVVAEGMATSIIDDGMCGSASYESGLASATLVAAHREGCAAAEGLGIL